MPITDWPNADKPREKLLQQGEQVLTTAELIAIFINTGTRGKTALDIAKELLVEHGSLKRLLQVPPRLLTQKSGVGPAKYATLKAAFELGRRFFQETITIGETLTNPRSAQAFLAAQLQHNRNEVFACLFLDTHCRVLAYEALFHGTINEAAIYPREILRRSLHHNAAKIILAHNHPSGLATPSQADQTITQHIKKALALVDTQIIDHVIIGNPDHYSFAENGLI